jgi:hypothetical protein
LYAERESYSNSETGLFTRFGGLAEARSGVPIDQQRLRFCGLKLVSIPPPPNDIGFFGLVMGPIEALSNVVWWAESN